MTALTEFQELLCKAVSAQTAPIGHEIDDDSSCSLFVVDTVINRSGGRTGCFLYGGRLVTPAPRSRTPDCSPCHRVSATCQGLELAAQRLVPQQAGDDLPEGEQGWGELEGQDLTLYMSYEQASPKMKRRTATARTPVAPWRVSLRDARDDMLFCARGLPQRILVDEEARLAVWSPTVAVAFPSAEDVRAFAGGLSQVEVHACCLAGSPHSVLLAAHAAEQRLARTTKVAADAAACSPPAASSAFGAATAYPPSPDLLPSVPRVGSKRPAEAPLNLRTPCARPRLHSGAAPITPACPPNFLI